MPTLDVFRADGFNTAALTEAILKAPYVPMRLGELGLFRSRGISVTTVQVEEKSGQLSLIQTSPRGAAPPDPLGQPKRTLRSFAVPHLAREATVNADEVQNVRAFGSETEVQVVQAMVDDRLSELRQMHEVTLERHRISAVQGTILDADGSTIYNLFTEFNVTQQTKDFVFGTATTDIRGTIIAAKRLAEAELGGLAVPEWHGFCGATWFDKLVSHATVTDAFKFQEGRVLGADLRYAGFTFGGVIWEEYRGAVVSPGGTSVAFIDTDQAYLVPMAAPSLFVVHYAPADFMETVNTIGLPIYAKQAPDPSGFNRFVALHTQSNPLALCLRPRSVIKCTRS
ncbi:MAG TPA: major capsid protein [Methylomirabilota bacterium]|jgi:hypothetical protein|nr:major capsid protein [Methylomirabilota bacterium]